MANASQQEASDRASVVSKCTIVSAFPNILLVTNHRKELAVLYCVRA